MKPSQRNFRSTLPTVLTDQVPGDAHSHYPMKKLKQKASFTRKTYTDQLMEQLEADQRVRDSLKKERQIIRKTL